MNRVTATVIVERRSFWSRLVRLPGVFRAHYRILRCTNGRIVSVYAAWLFAGMLLRVE